MLKTITKMSHAIFALKREAQDERCWKMCHEALRRHENLAESSNFELLIESQILRTAVLGGERWRGAFQSTAIDRTVLGWRSASAPPVWAERCSAVAQTRRLDMMIEWIHYSRTVALTQPERIGSRANWTEIHQPALPTPKHTLTHLLYTVLLHMHVHLDLHEWLHMHLTDTEAVHERKKHLGAHAACAAIL